MDVVVAAGGAAWEAAALAEIEASARLRLARRCVDVADLLSVVDTGLATVAFVALGLPGLDVDAVHRLERSGIRVVAVGADPGSARDLGIARVLAVGALDGVDAVDPVAEPPTGGPVGAPLVAVWGPAGAPGRSTVALGLAAARAAAGTDTVLVDADTYGGALGQMLAVLDDVSGIVAACRAANQGRAAEVGRHLLQVDPGLRLLTGVPREDMWSQLRPGALELVLRRLRATAELLVVDCGFSLDPAGGRNVSTQLVLEQADTVVVVGRPDPVGLSRLVRGLHDLAEAVPSAVPRVVVNLARPSLGWRERDVDASVRRLAGVGVEAFLPADTSSTDLALISGRTLRHVAPASPLVTAMESLAAAVAPRAASRPSTPDPVVT